MEEGHRTCLLVVDVQRLLVDAHPTGGRELLATISQLLAACRACGIECIYVRHGEDHAEGLVPGSDGWQIAEEIAPLAGERVFDKRHSSAFYRTGLREYLRERGLGTIIIVGMQTEYCIDATIKAGFEHGFSLVIPASGNTTYDNAFLRSAQLVDFYERLIWDGRFGRVISEPEALALVESDTAPS